MNLIKPLCIILITTAPHARSVHAGQFSFNEVEPNDSLLAPQVFPAFPVQSYGHLGSLVVSSSSLSPGDVDFFQVHFPQIVIFGAADALFPGPSLIGLFDADGTMIDLADDGLMMGELNPGTYTFAVTGAADTGFIGDHSQSFNYSFSLSWVVIPAPGAIIALGIAGLLGRSRRRSS